MLRLKILIVSVLSLIVFSIVSACQLLPENSIFDDGRNIRFIFDEGLNDDPRFRLGVDENGFYHMELENEGQNFQRISVRLFDGENVAYSKCCGRRHGIQWSNNLYWWVMEGDTVANITRTYFNPFTGEIQFINLPPLVNWRDELIPTINPSSITDERSGRASTIIAPIGKMKGDTMTVYVRYNHEISKWTERSAFYTSIGSREIIDSVKIILN